MRLALYQPDIPQNAGTILRLGACLALGVDIIEPCGFALSDARLRRAGLDYAARASLTTHTSWAAFQAARTGRLIAVSPHAATSHLAFAFRPGDTLLLGPESTGLPDSVRAAAEAEVRIPLAAGMRSLNVAVAAAMVAGEALRQTDAFPASAPETP